ncbi:MAG: bifunctional diguanylate cyclase/phosphodiesterase [Gammaproteobacteria bacterium]|nr:bifunctional diguanylate cyclase/phosphodiesterase [Gammaproteobacteria bacterium]MBU0788103.1 bifunctional diguanylate cyclase/phosphodiesterase [Gammaproteobacteria bacterium]MBU0815399.1 bifunctional diguanylate cyclase/phosphodiesterase [Gammaproteobacteria bacterium]MBU1785493.1 bifunctional diguanylate cyclase/phosphodiesterase [Gammaproteobacteria bacterium]
MHAPDAQTLRAHEAGGVPVLPLRLLLRFADAAYERRFVQHYVAFYFRYAQVSLVLGMVLILGDYLVDRIAYGALPANTLRLTTALPVLICGLGYSMLPKARRHWQPMMSSFIVTVAFCLFVILLRIDVAGGAGLKSWVGVLNFTFLEFYCFVILGVQFRYALASGLVILAAFGYALWWHAGLSGPQAAYWSYHVLTLFILAAGIGWWREYLLRKEFVARAALDDSRAAAEQRALQLAHYDEVTGLPNRRLFAQLAAPTLERSSRKGSGCAVLHVEIDRLGGVHDIYGRSQVDTVLAGITQRIRQCIRGGDVAAVSPASDDPSVVARLGDNAFSILIADLDSQERASPVAQRLLAAVAQPIVIDAQPLVLSASIGIAMFPGDAQDLMGLMRCAEQAARAADDAGGAQHKFFDEALDARARDRALLEAELRQAIPAGQLCLHYQPKVDVRSGRIVGAEALVRWQHPQRGLIMPGRFITLAEESGLIVPLTSWVLHAACNSLRCWADAGLRSLPLSVNLPASSLADVRLLDQLDELMQHYGLSPSSLMLELTETMLMHDVASVIDVLDRLRARGFGLSLDDFGTGYSSLSYLKRLPVSELKIDRSFVTDVARGGRDGALAAAVITLGSELGLQVVAEGVETTEQSEFLLGRGCVLQQGFLYSKAVPLAEFEQMLETGTPLRG